MSAMFIKIRKASEVKASEIVNKDFYLNRRNFLSAVASLGGATLIPTLTSPANAARERLKNIKTIFMNSARENLIQRKTLTP